MNMMDPEFIRLDQERMSRMSSADFAKIQQRMMAHTELMRMATESMKNLRPEDLRHAAEQLKHTLPEEMAEIGEKMANSTPEEIATTRTRLDAHINYELNGAQMLKKQGNELHSQGKYDDALQKYFLVKNNLKGIPLSKGQALQLACSLNLMSCYLKTKQYDECIREGSVNLFPRDVKERLVKEGGKPAPRGLAIEKINEEEEETVSSSNSEGLSSQYTEAQSQEISDPIKNKRVASNDGLSSNSDHLRALKNNPEAMRSFQNFIANTDPETLAALNPGNSREVSANMLRIASNVIGKMSLEELQKKLQLASSSKGDNQSFRGGALGANSNSFKAGSVPSNVSPDMLKAASDMISKMSPEERQKMFEMASRLREKDLFPMLTSALNKDGPSSDSELRYSVGGESSIVNETNTGGESSSHGSFANSRSVAPPSSIPTSTIDMQEQMRNHMKDPAMPQELLPKGQNKSLMSGLRGMQKLTEWDSTFVTVDRIQRGVEGITKTKNWLMGRPGMILEICMLILAMILHRLGYIGG